MMDRRRLIITAAMGALGTAVSGRPAAAAVWQGTALGADVTLTVRGPRAAADHALAGARATLTETDRLFSLYDPASTLSQLNTAGHLDPMPAPFADAMALCERVWRLTDGRFDPTVQPLWRALAVGADTAAAQAAVGWERVRVSGPAVRLGPGQALTLNGIAQGIATDRVAATLAAHGATAALVNVGEFRGVGGPWRLGLSDPVHGHLGARTLNGGAVATSSPGALTLPDGSAHILSPRGGAPQWSTVSVEAATAGLADALSTAFCLMERDAIAALRPRLPDVRRITLVDEAGDLITL